jgi:bacteriocin-like protein
MTKQKQMTEKDLDQVSGGAGYLKIGDLTGPRGFDSGAGATNFNIGEASLTDPTWVVGREIDPIFQGAPDCINDTQRGY